jgi:hypothetical protein
MTIPRALLNKILYGTTFGVAVLTFLFTTPLGLGLSPDSISYLKGAMGVLNGHGLEYISAQWPPLFPLLIAVAGAIPDDVVLGARIVNALCFGSTVILTAALVSRLTHWESWKAILFASLIFIQPSMRYVYFYAWSEPTLLVLILIDLLLLSNLTSTSRKIFLLTSLVAIASLALYVRFAGVIVAVTNCIVIFIAFGHRPVWQSIGRASIQLLIPVALFIPWTMHQGISDGAATARIIEFHPITEDTVTKGLMTLGRWLQPTNLSGYDQPLGLWQLCLGATIFTLMLASTIFTYTETRNLHARVVTKTTLSGSNQTYLALACGLLFCSYVLFLLGALSFVDNKVALDNRILVLVFPAVILALLRLVLRTTKPAVRYIFVSVLIGLMLSAAPGLKGWLLLSRYGGIEMNSRSVVTSPLQTAVRTCEKDKLVYSDRPWDFDLHFKQKVLWLPSETLYNSGKPNANYLSDIAAALKIADLIILQKENSIVAQLESSARFTKIRATKEGDIWQRYTGSPNLCSN